MIKKKTSKLIRLSKKNNFTLSVAESCTGGLLSSSIIQESGASNFFHMGFTTYSNKAKINILSVNPNIIKNYGAVSEETALEMVKGVYKKTKSNLSISITGVAGPKGGTKINPVGTVCFGIGINYKDKSIIYKTIKKKFNLRTRIGIQKKSVIFVLDNLIEIILTHKFD